MGKAEEGSCDKEVGRNKEVPPYPAAFSGTGGHGPQTQRGRRQGGHLLVQAVI